MILLPSADGGRVVFSFMSTVNRDISPAGEMARTRSRNSSQSCNPDTRCGTYFLVVTEYAPRHNLQAQ